MPDGHRFYCELATWWPLISPPEDYAEEASFIATLLRSADGAVNDVLELGSGGGHMASHLTGQFAMTLVDLSPDMLAISRQLNPECEHLLGDMRTVHLDREFDAVLIHDAIDYMTTRDDLLAAIRNAFVHCRPGGVAVFVPDDTTETYAPSTDHDGHDAPDGRGARYLEWSRDPDPDDTTISTEYSFLLRETDGTVRSEHETHVTGLFPIGEWLKLMESCGFEAETVDEVTTEDRAPRKIFVGRRSPPRI